MVSHGTCLLAFTLHIPYVLQSVVVGTASWFHLIGLAGAGAGAAAATQLGYKWRQM
jgi:hypothetical protein